VGEADKSVGIDAICVNGAVVAASVIFANVLGAGSVISGVEGGEGVGWMTPLPDATGVFYFVSKSICATRRPCCIRT